MSSKIRIPIIDLFAGPGGLGEGFSAYGKSDPIFKIALSIEKDRLAHETLELRSFYRQFEGRRVPEAYYQHLRNKATRSELFSKYPVEAEKAKREAWRATLGETAPDEVDERIRNALKGKKTWVLAGGPPCQAFSIVGRSRKGGIDPKDPNVFLYREYLRILAVHTPPVFIMENVKGLLSSKLGKNRIFDQIRSDLRDPAISMKRLNGKTHKVRNHAKYMIFPLVKTTADQTHLFGDGDYKPNDFIIKCENFGIPQARHRIILVGVREDLIVPPGNLEESKKTMPLSEALKNLPKLRSGLSIGNDSKDAWKNTLKEAEEKRWFKALHNQDHKVYLEVNNTLKDLSVPRNDRGSEFIKNAGNGSKPPSWFLDSRIQGICNHQTRGHMGSDLWRYLFSACFAKAHGRSPKLIEFPKDLLPKHSNVGQALSDKLFEDRFRVQLADSPSYTITSHISKDGHYYIHPDPAQCRSLTVREAARLQTFPDNYFFCGPRTSQYIQVGNAVPPLLAKQIAKIVHEVLIKNGLV